ncbi:hypothetical protein PoB_005493400 [Plakobranchus ocellatus]|uniref:Secreted protein n=1 Tax=Plakobranchus ocellatus TaxID=259542 RepID=A0AAV4C7A3_9GAST|nr:hypothetical protein PoB_005493400 [Plakobranchus ocellatus]
MKRRRNLFCSGWRVVIVTGRFHTSRTWLYNRRVLMMVAASAGGGFQVARRKPHKLNPEGQVHIKGLVRRRLCIAASW